MFYHEEDNIGNRELPKERCLGMDWNNAKEITAKEIAYCIHTHEINLNKVPENRLRSVMKQVQKLHKQKEANQELKMIEAELAIYDKRRNPFSMNENDILDYYLEPSLFKSWKEAHIAVNELHLCDMHVDTNIENEYKYRQPNTRSRDIRRMQRNMNNIREQYVNLGGDIELFNKMVQQIKLPQAKTIKEDINSRREYIVQQFIELGTSSTRANELAIAITNKAYQLLQ